jgi:ADP-ribosylglycohydrolase
MPTDESRYLGSLLGLAAADALGTTVEFSPPGSFPPLTTIVGGGPFNLEKGEWTDDTSMALCLAESLISRGGFDARDQMERYVRWYRQGHLSSNGRCFDIGNTCRAGLQRFVLTGEPFSGSTDPYMAGNGSLMRLAPVPLYFAWDPETAIRLAGESSRTTHAAPCCIDACRYYAALIVGALRGESKQALLAPFYSPVPGLWQRQPLCPEVAAIASASFAVKHPPEIRGTGYVVQALEAALWAFHHSRSFEDGALLAVNLGDDADTTGAIYGQLAGAYYGLDAIPDDWVACLAHLELLEDFAEKLFQGSRKPGVPQEPGHSSWVPFALPEREAAVSRKAPLRTAPLKLYEVVPGKFLAGEYPGDRYQVSAEAKVDWLQKAGVTLFVDLTEEADGLTPYQGLLTQARHVSFPITDVSVPRSPEHTRAILDCIDAEIAQGGCVYLHCMGGVGRTGTIVGCWLARHGDKGEAAFEALQVLWAKCPKSVWRCSPETGEQSRYLMSWEG